MGTLIFIALFIFITKRIYIKPKLKCGPGRPSEAELRKYRRMGVPKKNTALPWMGGDD